MWIFRGNFPGRKSNTNWNKSEKIVTQIQIKKQNKSSWYAIGFFKTKMLMYLKGKSEIIKWQKVCESLRFGSNGLTQFEKKYF